MHLIAFSHGKLLPREIGYTAGRQNSCYFKECMTLLEISLKGHACHTQINQCPKKIKTQLLSSPWIKAMKERRTYNCGQRTTPMQVAPFGPIFFGEKVTYFKID